MKTVWTKDLKELSSKQDYELGLRNNIYLKKLLDILGDRERELTSKLISTPEGEAWLYKQVHLQGRLFDLKETIDLLTFDQRQTPSTIKELNN